ncbi:MAG: carbohydrate ABC transporter permease [Caldilineaceae bacterium]|nr:carbohydrate ABC transporter permease [Caldilineaceae bacterium]MBP8108251.1 carbohydrate ABC transporter permease [Caldilineaceae bacterium]MBP8121658.1 carbohydrate ABC transporter permease [Caldilineaceae bacterium]MBP9071642.1 carbohydrate ABC transporter permease [Caldilineaceae bacterium]
MKATSQSLGWGRRTWTLAVMLFLIAVMVLPFLWMVSTSLKSQEYILTVTPQFIPKPATLESYVTLAQRIDLGRIFFNSFFVAIVGSAGQILVAAMAAFAFSRITWRGRDTVFLLYLATMMIPSVVLVLPQFALVRSLGWVNTYAALIVPGLVSAFGTFLLRQSFLTLPKDFEEAAFVDGANYFTIFWRIVLPLSRPAMATLAIFSFMGLWNSYLWPLFVARKASTMTLPVALAVLQSGPRALTEWNVVMAGAVVTVLPILLVYLLAQRWFVQGIVTSGIKG